MTYSRPPACEPRGKPIAVERELERIDRWLARHLPRLLHFVTKRNIYRT
jgi:hypothetical protein